MLATGDGAEGFIIFAVNVVSVCACRCARQNRQDGEYLPSGQEGVAFPGAWTVLRIFPGLLQHGIVVEAPVVAVSGSATVVFNSSEPYR